VAPRPRLGPVRGKERTHLTLTPAHSRAAVPRPPASSEADPEPRRSTVLAYLPGRSADTRSRTRTARRTKWHPPLPSVIFRRGWVVRTLDPSDVDAVVDLSLQAWEPLFLSVREVMGLAISSRLWPDWRKSQAAQVREACTSTMSTTCWVVAAATGVPVGFVAVKPSSTPSTVPLVLPVRGFRHRLAARTSGTRRAAPPQPSADGRRGVPLPRKWSGLKPLPLKVAWV